MKYLWISLAVIVLLVLIVVAVGYSLPVKHHATSETSVKVTPDSLFALLTDINGYPKWRDVKSVEVLPVTDGKLRFREVSSNGPMTFVVEASDPPRRFVTRIDDKSLPFGGTWTYELTPGTDGRTTLRISEDGEVYNPIFRFVSRFVMGHDATMKQYLAAVSKRFPG